MKTITKNKVGKVFLVIAFMLVMSPLVYSLGVAPARTVVQFEPNLEIEKRLIIINNEQRDFWAAVYIKGDLKEYVEFEEAIIHVTASESQKVVYYKIKLPPNFKNPGGHMSQIVILELPDDFALADKGMLLVDEESIVYSSQNKKTTVSKRAGVIQQLLVEVPYPGIYAEGKMYITADQIGEPVGFKINIYNFGKANIAKARAKIKILGPTNEVLATVESNEVSLKPSTEGMLVAEWKADANPGTYKAVAEVSYDGKKFDIEQLFTLGNLFISINDISVNDFKLGDIAKFDIDIESKWNQLIDDVYGEISILDSVGAQQGTYKTETIKIRPHELQTLSAYWDTEGKPVGNYDVSVIIHYAGKTTVKLFDIVLALDSIQMKYSPTAEATGADVEAGISRDTILLLIVVILVVVNIVWLVVFVKKKAR